MTPIERATVAALASLASEYTTADAYLSPRVVPAHATGAQTLSDRRTFHADALDPKREYPAERASLRGAVTLATGRREPWHARLCEALAAEWAGVARQEKRETGVRRDHADVFAWAETLFPEPDGSVSCPTFADCTALLAAVRERMLDGLAPLSPADVIAVAAVVLPNWGLSLVQEDGQWVARAAPTYAPRHTVKRAATADGAASDLLAGLPFRMSASEARCLASITGAP
jgi:hypothetical protein